MSSSKGVNTYMECLVEFPDGRVQYMSAKEANALKAKEDLRLRKIQTRKTNSHEKINNSTSNFNVNDGMHQENQTTKKEHQLPNRGILSFASKLFLHTFR